MKRLFLLFSAFLCIAAIWSCKKNTDVTLPYNVYGVSDKQGQLKIVYASAYLANPTVLIKINGKAVSNLITGRTPFPGGGYNTAGSNFALYLAVPQGADTIRIVKPKVGTDIDSLVFYSTIVTIPDNKAYTLHIADTLVNATQNNTASLLVQNDISAIDTGLSRYRFVNLIPNVATPNGAVDLYLNDSLLVSNLGYLKASAVFTTGIGAKAPGVTNPASIPTPTWAVRPAGAARTTLALASYASANTMGSQRVFTVFAMGYVGGTANRLPYVSFTLDKNQ